MSVHGHRTSQTAAALLLVIVVSNVTYFRNYGYPRGSFYDEAIYIADAQKYLTGTFFMQDHPPLGKLLIAAGERLLRMNADDTEFMSVTVASEFPDQFSFLGYRLLPVLLAWWTAPLLFLLFLQITARRQLAILLSCLYMFDNALIVHLRGAMLEGPLVFFSVLTLLLFVIIWKADAGQPITVVSAGFGAALGLAITTKEAALILAPLVPAAIFKLRPVPRRAARFAIVCGAAFACVFFGVWQTHFAIARRVNPVLPDGGYFGVSPEYRSILDEHRTASPLAFPVMIRDAFRMTAEWNRALPPLNLCDPKEPGSPVFFWPFGARAINYRSETTDGKAFRYLYLQSNPVVWAVGLIAVIISTGALIGSLVAPPLRPFRNRALLVVFTGMYFVYLFGLGMMNRVLYLHAYFIPLILTFVIAALLVADVERFGRWALTPRSKTIGLSVLAAMIVAAYGLYYPLTYFTPLTDAQLERRAVIRLWDLTCANCPRGSGLLRQCGP